MHELVASYCDIKMTDCSHVFFKNAFYHHGIKEIVKYKICDDIFFQVAQ